MNSSYYVFDYNTRNVIIFNEFWEYQRTITLLSNPKYSVYANDEIYVSYYTLVGKYDKDLNFLFQSNAYGSNYNGIYLNESNGLLYAASTDNLKIDIFNKNLSYSNSINTTFKPWSIAEYNDMIAVSDYSTGNINFFKNNIHTSNVSTSCHGIVTSILFDKYDHMIVLCYSPSYLYIHHTNGTFTGTVVSVCSSSSPMFMNFDSKHRLVVVCLTNITIFY